MYRIQKYPQGYLVEKQHKKWHGKTYWKFHITYAGLHDTPYYFDTFDGAMKALLFEVKKETIENSHLPYP